MKVDNYLNDIEKDDQTDPPIDEPRKGLVEHVLRPGGPQQATTRPVGPIFLGAKTQLLRKSLEAFCPL